MNNLTPTQQTLFDHVSGLDRFTVNEATIVSSMDRTRVSVYLKCIVDKGHLLRCRISCVVEGGSLNSPYHYFQKTKSNRAKVKRLEFRYERKTCGRARALSKYASYRETRNKS